MSSVKSQKKKIDNAIATTNLSCASVIARLFDNQIFCVGSSLDQFIKQISWSARTKGPTKVHPFTSLVSFRSSREIAAIWPSLLVLLVPPTTTGIRKKDTSLSRPDLLEHPTTLNNADSTTTTGRKRHQFDLSMRSWTPKWRLPAL